MMTGHHWSRLNVSVAAALVILAALLSSTNPIHAQVVVRVWYPSAKAALSSVWVQTYNDARAGRVVVEGTSIPLYQLEKAFMEPGDPPPDVVFAPSDWAGGFVNARLLTQLDSRISPDFRAQISEIGWRSATYDSRIIGVPILLEGYALYYNKALLLDVPVPSTLDELLNAAKTVQERGEGALIGLNLLTDYFPTGGLISTFGEPVITETGQSWIGLGNAFRVYLETLLTLSKAPGVTLNQPDQAFREKRAGMLIGGSWALPEYLKALGTDLGVAPLPAVNLKPWKPLVRSWVMYVRLGSPSTDAAVDFARFLAETAPQTLALQMGEIPVNPLVFETDPLVGAFARYFAQQGEPLSNRVEFRAYWIPINRAIQDVLNGWNTPEAAALAAAEQIDSALLGQ
ncbi:Maltose/maltodextrin-binding periplasmic protein [Anaerolineae bacterium]|nr:Maltose/maltodextrin-binding periplasmic protein [Anaerolineae bacterium]